MFSKSISQELNLLSLSQISKELKQESKECVCLFWCIGKTGIRNEDISNSGLRNPRIMKVNNVPISWKAFRDNCPGSR